MAKGKLIMETTYYNFRYIQIQFPKKSFGLGVYYSHDAHQIGIYLPFCWIGIWIGVKDG